MAQYSKISIWQTLSKAALKKIENMIQVQSWAAEFCLWAHQWFSVTAIGFELSNHQHFIHQAIIAHTTNLVSVLYSWVSGFGKLKKREALTQVSSMILKFFRELLCIGGLGWNHFTMPSLL